MRGSSSILITFLLVAVAVGLYIGLAKGKLDEQKRTLKNELQAKEDTIDANEAKIARIPQLEAQLPTWRKQFQLFRAAIPVELDDDIFLRNLTEQMNANGVRLVHLELVPAGQWFTNVNAQQEEAFKKEHMRPEEIRQVKVAHYTVNLVGSFPGVLRAFENLKLYGRIYSITSISGPAGGGAGAVFQVDNASEIPIQVTGDIYYGISDRYLSQQTLEEFFGAAEATKAAASVHRAATRRADQLVAEPTAVPHPAAKSSKPAGAGKQPAGTETDDSNVASPGSADARYKSKRLTPGGANRRLEANHG